MGKIKLLFLKFWHVLLLITAVVALLLQPEQMTLKQVANRINQKLANDYSNFEKLAADNSFINKIFSGKADIAELELAKESGLRIYAYQNDALAFWSENKSLLITKPSSIPDGASLQRLQNGWFIAFKKSFENQRAFVALVLIQHAFPTPGKFLSNNLDVGLSIAGRFKFSATALNKENFLPVKLNGNTLFYITEINAANATEDNFLIVLLLFIILLVFSYYVNRAAIWTVYKNGFGKGFLFLLIGSLVLFASANFFRIYFGNALPPLFKPVYCASSWLVLSLGDLLLYVLLVVWWLLFASKYGKYNYPIAQPKWKRHLHQSLLLLCVYIASIGTTALFKVLILDSVVSLQVANVLGLNLYSFIGLIIIALTILAHYLVSARAMGLIYGASLPTNTIIINCFGIAAVVSIIFYNHEFSEVFIATALWTTAWLLILLLTYEEDFTLNRTRNLVLLTALYAIFATYLEENLYEKRERNLRKLAADALMQERDYFTESGFEATTNALKKDPFFTTTDTTINYKSAIVREHLNTFYFDKYLNKYDVQYNIFSGTLTPTEVELFEYYKKRIATAENRNEILNFCADSTDNYTYLALTQLGNNATIAIELTPRVYAAGNLYAELIADNSLANRVNEEGFSYAIYRNNKLVAQRGEYAYSYYWNNEYAFNGQKEVFIDVPGWEHNIHDGENNKRVIVTVKQESFFEPVAAFSYLFTLFFLVATGFLLYVRVRRKILYNESPLGGFYTSFRTRINYLLIVIILTSFIVIGVITISFFSQQYKRFYSDRLVAKEQAVVSALELTLQSLGASSYQTDLLERLGEELSKLSQINDIDINLFTLQGDLAATSQSPLYDRGIVSRKMNPTAFLHLKENKQSQLTQNEKIGNLEYRATYIPLKDKQQNTLAFIGIPYYERNQTIDDEVSAFLIALMNVYVFLLICAGALAYFISNSVTRPLTFIAEKLQVVNLGRKNEPIEWNSKDEIGILVKQYNRMIREIENSAEQLARNERETAWREMAKQIAHEIKNPLTPMKLSIQYLQRAINENNPNVNELAARVTKTLVEQIDNLTAIATSFSSFAKMPKGENELVDLNEMLRGITDLFSREQEANISFETNIEKAIVFADRNQMLSVFNNLVKNGIQAVPDEVIPEVKVFITEEHEMIKVEVKDNGIGIAEENYAKVFAPNFTTKSSGTGLGLAISLQIIEGNGGAIWFESVVGEGTSFFVVIPRHNDKSED